MSFPDDLHLPDDEAPFWGCALTGIIIILIIHFSIKIFS